MYNRREDLIFDRNTYKFLGKRRTYLGTPQVEASAPPKDWRTQPPGANYDLAWTVLATKAVDHLPHPVRPNS